jgi:hypothetical protein
MPGLPEEVAEAVMQAMVKEPDARFHTAGEFVATIDIEAQVANRFFTETGGARDERLPAGV